MLALLLLACLADRALLSVPARLAPSADTLTPEAGVSLRLEAATVGVEALHVDGPTTLAGLPWVRAAYAHPGHGGTGEVVGELLGPWDLDLLGEPISLGDALIYEGEAASARLSLGAAPGARLRGVAELEGETRDFDLYFAESIEITEIPFAQELSAEAPPTGLRLSVDLAHALSFIDWQTPDADGDGLLTEADGATAETLAFGLVATPTWTLTLED